MINHNSFQVLSEHQLFIEYAYTKKIKLPIIVFSQISGMNLLSAVLSMPNHDLNLLLLEITRGRSLFF